MDPPLVIPVFIPHSGCPHHCIFCNQSLITGSAARLPSAHEICGTIREYLGFRGRRSRVELAFFGGNFLGLAKREIRRLLTIVKPFIDRNEIHGIRFSTRPDTVTPDRLDLVAPFGVCLVELGVQSMEEGVLEKIQRGHTAQDTLRALDRLKRRGIPAGVQVMVGLPGESEQGMMQGFETLAARSPETARIYPLVVLRGTGLARWMTAGRYRPLTLDRAVFLAKQVYRTFTGAGVRVIRMGLQATEIMGDPSHVLAGPWHPAFGHLVLSALVYDGARERIASLVRDDETPARIRLRVHPRCESRLRGNKNANMAGLKTAYPFLDFTVETDPGLEENRVEAVRSLP